MCMCFLSGNGEFAGCGPHGDSLVSFKGQSSCFYVLRRVVGEAPGGRVVGEAPGGLVVGEAPGGLVVGEAPGGRVVGEAPGGRVVGEASPGLLNTFSNLFIIIVVNCLYHHTPCLVGLVDYTITTHHVWLVLLTTLSPHTMSGWSC